MPKEFLIGSDYVVVEFGVRTTPVVSSSCKPNVVTVNLVRVAYARGGNESLPCRDDVSISFRGRPTHKDGKSPSGGLRELVKYLFEERR